MNISSIDRSSARVFAVGTPVCFKPAYLVARPDLAKRVEGRVGMVTGYRLGAAEPIVHFPRAGRRKELKLFEVPNSALEVASTLDHKVAMAK